MPFKLDHLLHFCSSEGSKMPRRISCSSSGKGDKADPVSKSSSVVHILTRSLIVATNNKTILLYMCRFLCAPLKANCHYHPLLARIPGIPECTYKLFVQCKYCVISACY